MDTNGLRMFAFSTLHLLLFSLRIINDCAMAAPERGLQRPNIEKHQGKIWGFCQRKIKCQLFICLFILKAIKTFDLGKVYTQMSHEAESSVIFGQS